MDIFSYKLGQKRGGGSGSGAIALQDKTITENGTYTADAEYDGLGTVTVDVAGSGGSDEDWIIGDGNTHLWITLTEGRTSPMLGVGVNGTVTVDWGDGTEPDVLTGTNRNTEQWTPHHEYAAAGDYVITLTVEGEMLFGGRPTTDAYGWILRYATGTDTRNAAYRAVLKKVETGDNVVGLDASAFRQCRNLSDVIISNSVTSINSYVFSTCYALSNIIIPDSVTSIGSYMFEHCSALSNIVIPNSVTSIGSNAFYDCLALSSIVIPNSVTSIGSNAFAYCYGAKFYDFTSFDVVPTLSATNVFSGIPADCEIRVPAALVDEWKAATNWSTYADYIVGV